MTTLYRIRTAGQHASYLRGLDGAAYSWCRRSEAVQLPRAEALATAARLAEAIRANGHLGVRILVVPATGGAAAGEVFRS